MFSALECSDHSPNSTSVDSFHSPNEIDKGRHPNIQKSLLLDRGGDKRMSTTVPSWVCCRVVMSENMLWFRSFFYSNANSFCRERDAVV